MKFFKPGTRVTIDPAGWSILNHRHYELFPKAWTIVCQDGYSNYRLECEGVVQYMDAQYLTKVKEEKPMNIKSITRKVIASLDQRNDESPITCAYCGCIIESDEAIEFNGEYYCCEDHLDEVSFVCDECGERFLDEEDNWVSGDHICNNCLEEHYAYCDQCERYVPNDEINFCNDDDAYVCNDCVEWERGYFRCPVCDEVHSLDEATIVFVNEDDRERWCNRCVDSNANYCEECGRWFDCNRVSVCNGRCEYCVPEEQTARDIRFWSAPEGVRGYSYKPDPCFCMTEEQQLTTNNNDLIYFGIELEMEDHRDGGYNCNEDADYMNEHLGFTYCKHDGSLDDGIELVSHPATLEYFMENKDKFKEVFAEMSRRGYTSHNNGNCGLHVHFSLKPFLEANPNGTSSLLRIVDNNWDKLVRFSRRTNYQLDRWAKRYFSKTVPFTELAKNVKRNCGRYMAVNLENAHTIEIRMFRGSLKINTFFAVLQMVRRLIDEAIAARSENEADAVTWEKLIDCEYAELKEYCQQRFAAHADDLDNLEPTPEPERRSIPTFDMSEEEMHIANIHVGDPIILGDGPTERCRPYFVGRTGTVETIGSSYVHCPEITLATGEPLNIRHTHAHRTNGIRIGDYVRITRTNRAVQQSVDWVNQYVLDFSDDLTVGTIGIVRAFETHHDVRNSCETAVVEFSSNFRGAHNCRGSVPSGYGQYIPMSCIELV